MTEGEVTADEVRLLVLISRFSSPAGPDSESEVWVKKMPLMAMITRGILKGVFKDYDLAPTLVEYMGESRYANVSKEGEDDVADLRRRGLVERLKLATRHHYHVSAYRVTQEGLELVKRAGRAYTEAIDGLTTCAACGGRAQIITMPDAPYLQCDACAESERIGIFDIRKVPYTSSPVFTDLWLPPP